MARTGSCFFDCFHCTHTQFRPVFDSFHDPHTPPEPHFHLGDPTTSDSAAPQVIWGQDIAAIAQPAADWLWHGFVSRGSLKGPFALPAGGMSRSVWTTYLHTAWAS